MTAEIIIPRCIPNIEIQCPHCYRISSFIFDTTDRHWQIDEACECIGIEACSGKYVFEIPSKGDIELAKIRGQQKGIQELALAFLKGGE